MKQKKSKKQYFISLDKQIKKYHKKNEIKIDPNTKLFLRGLPKLTIKHFL